MLTDYHTHLRPDVSDTPPSRYFTEANVQRYLDAARARGIAELGFSEHVYRFREASTIWRHPFWEEYASGPSTTTASSSTGMPVRARYRGRLDPGPRGADRARSSMAARGTT